MISKSEKKSLVVKTGDITKVDDSIKTTKPWFNGFKEFFTVKVLPKIK